MVAQLDDGLVGDWQGKGAGEMSEEDEHMKAARAFGEAAKQCADAIGKFGGWTYEWTCEADSGSLSPVFGVDLSTSDDIVYTVVIGHPREPADHIVDGLTVRECLERYTEMQRGDGSPPWLTWKGTPIGPTARYALTPAQKDAARLAWSAELKRKQQEAGETERRGVCVDDDRWEP